MARTMVEHKIDDLSGEEDDTIEAVRFLGDDENVYEIDLGKENRDTYDEFVAKHQAKARLIGPLGRIRPPEPAAPAKAKGEGRKTTAKSKGSATRSSGSPATRMDREQGKAMREWARNHGWPTLSDRGRIPDEVTEAYHHRPAA